MTVLISIGLLQGWLGSEGPNIEYGLYACKNGTIGPNNYIDLEYDENSFYFFCYVRPVIELPSSIVKDLI